MLLTCPCQQCQTVLEFEAEQLGQFIQCPTCQKETRLLDSSGPKNYFEPAPAPLTAQKPTANQGPAIIATTAPARNTGRINPKLTTCSDCQQEISLRALMCPKCGNAVGIRFRIIWEIIGHVALASFLLGAIGWIILISFGMACNHTAINQ